MRLARQVAAELDPGRTSAVVLVGSWARGDAHVASDVDLWVVGARARRPHRNLERGGRLVTVRYTTEAHDLRELRNSARMDGAVSGWRRAQVLWDPNGAAARLRRAARRIRWRDLRGARDRYVAHQLAGWAEEVRKLLRAMETGERETASVQRNLLATHLPVLRAAQLEVRGDSENGLWERTARRAGPAFRAAMRSALGTDGGDWRGSCEGALRLYALTAGASLPTLAGEPRRIVLATCRRAGYPIDEARSKER